MQIATVEDFKRLAEEKRIAGAEPVQLPSGLVVLARRCSPEWWLLHVGKLPASLSAKITGATEETSFSSLSTKEMVDYAKWAVELIQASVVSPVIKLNPGPDELDPNFITEEDRAFLIKYAGGEVSADGSNLDSFPGR